MKKILSGLLAVLITMALVGCSGRNSIQKKDTPYPVTVGNATILEQPEKVATLSAQFTNILCDLGYEDAIVAAADEEVEDDSEWKAIGSALVPNIKAIKKAKPDVLFTSSPMTASQLDELWEAGVQVVVLDPITSLDTLYARYYDVIAAMDGKVEANTAGVALTDAMKGDVERLLAQIPEKKATFLCVYTVDPFVVTPDTFEGSLLAMLGENVATGKNYVAENDLKKVNANILLYDAAIDAKKLRADETLSGVSKNKQEFDRLKLSDGTKGAIEEMYALAALLYPEVTFGDPSSADIVVENESDESSAEE